MEIYHCEKGFILAVRGGKFYDLVSEPRAIILKSRPVPVNLWTLPTVKSKSLYKNQEWKLKTRFLEFNCDGKSVFVMTIDSTRIDDCVSGSDEFFLEESYFKEKLNSIRKNSWVNEFQWHPSTQSWNKVYPYREYTILK